MLSQNELVVVQSLWKNAKFTLSWRKFLENVDISSNQLFSNFFSKTLVSRNFCQKRVRVNFCNYHTVEYLQHPNWSHFVCTEIACAYVVKYESDESFHFDDEKCPATYFLNCFTQKWEKVWHKPDLAKNFHFLIGPHPTQF